MALGDIFCERHRCKNMPDRRREVNSINKCEPPPRSTDASCSGDLTCKHDGAIRIRRNQVHAPFRMRDACRFAAPARGRTC